MGVGSWSIEIEITGISSFKQEDSSFHKNFETATVSKLTFTESYILTATDGRSKKKKNKMFLIHRQRKYISLFSSSQYFYFSLCLPNFLPPNQAVSSGKKRKDSHQLRVSVVKESWYSDSPSDKNRKHDTWEVKHLLKNRTKQIFEMLWTQKTRQRVGNWCKFYLLTMTWVAWWSLETCLYVLYSYHHGH